MHACARCEFEIIGFIVQAVRRIALSSSAAERKIQTNASLHVQSLFICHAENRYVCLVTLRCAIIFQIITYSTRMWCVRVFYLFYYVRYAFKVKHKFPQFCIYSNCYAAAPKQTQPPRRPCRLRFSFIVNNARVFMKRFVCALVALYDERKCDYLK